MIAELMSIDDHWLPTVSRPASIQLHRIATHVSCRWQQPCMIAMCIGVRWDYCWDDDCTALHPTSTPHEAVVQLSGSSEMLN